MTLIAHRSALLPDLPANLTLSPGAIAHKSSFSQRAAADIAASIASANSNRPRSREGTPRADAEGPGRTKAQDFRTLWCFGQKRDIGKFRSAFRAGLGHGLPANRGDASDLSKGVQR
eukprot:s5021_g6.t1